MAGIRHPHPGLGLFFKLRDLPGYPRYRLLGRVGTHRETQYPRELYRCMFEIAGAVAAAAIGSPFRGTLCLGLRDT